VIGYNKNFSQKYRGNYFMECKNCGALIVNEDTASFCGACGSAVEKKSSDNNVSTNLPNMNSTGGVSSSDPFASGLSFTFGGQPQDQMHAPQNQNMQPPVQNQQNTQGQYPYGQNPQFPHDPNNPFPSGQPNPNNPYGPNSPHNSYGQYFQQHQQQQTERNKNSLKSAGAGMAIAVGVLSLLGPLLLLMADYIDTFLIISTIIGLILAVTFLILGILLLKKDSKAMAIVLIILFSLYALERLLMIILGTWAAIIWLAFAVIAIVQLVRYLKL